MPKLRASGVKMSSIVKKVQKSLVLAKRIANVTSSRNGGDYEEPASVPEDVKEGHFAVIAADGDETRRFVAPLKFLAHPTFLKLLEIAEEEYGFVHDGALTIPCKPVLLERVLLL